MKNLIKNLHFTRDELEAVAAFASSLPAGLRWDSQEEHVEQIQLIQLFWNGDRSERDARIAEAKIIAKAWGGKWERETDGAWRGRRGRGNAYITGQSLVLHDVEPVENGTALNLD